MENNNIKDIDTGLADESTTQEVAAPEVENFADVENDMDLTSDKIEELNKKLPSWSIEPPHNFVK